MKPATYGCEACEAKYNMGAETVVRTYLRQPWFNHLETICPGCGQVWFVWELVPESVAYMAVNNRTPGDEVVFRLKEFASEKVWRRFCEATGRNFPLEREISAHEQAHIEATVAFENWSMERETWT